MDWAEQWEAAKGITCLACGRETLRMLDGVCPKCARKAELTRALHTAVHSKAHRIDRLGQVAQLQRDLRELEKG